MTDNANKQSEFPDANVFLDSAIHTICHSPWGHTHNGKEIVRILYAFRNGNKILFTKLTEDKRAEELGDEIHINSEYYDDRCKTISELVHEGSHLLWRERHVRARKPEPFGDLVEDELECQIRQLKIYQWLKTVGGCSQDLLLDERLRLVNPKLGKRKYDKLKLKIADELK